jgi:hypothetical protein
MVTKFEEYPMKHLTRSDFLRGSAAMVAASLLPRASAETSRRPNVLLVIADEWRAQAFRYRGNPNASTASFDSFARQSVDFRNAASGTPLCCPGRASGTDMEFYAAFRYSAWLLSELHDTANAVKFQK